MKTWLSMTVIAPKREAPFTSRVSDSGRCQDRWIVNPERREIELKIWSLICGIATSYLPIVLWGLRLNFYRDEFDWDILNRLWHIYLHKYLERRKPVTLLDFNASSLSMRSVCFVWRNDISCTVSTLYVTLL